MDMASAEELGLVWMGDMLLHSEPTSLMMNSSVDPHRHTFFSEAQQQIEEIHRPSAPMYVQDMNNFLMLEELEDPYFEEPEQEEENGDPLKSVATSATQTAQGATPPSRKIKPIKHPGLKLQTPIAYQRDTDPNVIPIQKDGMAVCEKCGAIGVKHAFYTRERRFCSLACARSSSDGQNSSEENEDSNWIPPDKMDVDWNGPQKSTLLNHPTLPPPPLSEDDPPFPPDKKSQSTLSGTYEWTDLLSDSKFIAAPVSSFVHAPMATCWDNITVGMKVEVENTDCDNYSEDVPDSFWVATVLRIAGYKALLRYEGFGQNESKDFWVNLCSTLVHPVGWCATRGKPLIPPKTIEDKYKDWKHFLVKRLTGARTLPSHFISKVHENMRSRFRCDLNLEVVDKNRISQVKVATIKHIIGKRLHVQYYDAEPGDNGFWAHEDSPLIHPVGWAKRVGQTLAAPPKYVDRCLKGLRDKDDATEDLFPLFTCLPFRSGFQKGMKLEAVDPLNLSTICVATVMKVLNDGYLMIRIDSYDEDASSPGSDWFCYHSSSACILPAGYCETNGITLTPPNGHNATSFSWNKYLVHTGSRAAPTEFFDLEQPEHEFTLGQRLESADLMDPRLVCVATIAQIVGRLLRVHFDGWDDEYDQWLDCQSPDIYPVGWCQLVSHKLEGPHTVPTKPSPLQKGKEGRHYKKRKGRRGWHLRNLLRGKNSEEKHENGERGSSPTIHLECVPPNETYPSVISGPNITTLSLNSQPTKPSGEMVDSTRGLIPAMGEVPTGPDQALPDEPCPPSETCTLNNESEVSKVIPRLANTQNTDITKIAPEEWDEVDVCTFLRINNCAAYCDSFSIRKINGKALLNLTKDEIIDLTGMKVGPSLKIYDLIQQLKLKVNPAQERMRAGLKKLL